MCRLLHTVPCLRFSFLLATLQNGESPQAHAAIISPWSPYCIFQSVKAVFQKSVLYAFSTRSTVQPRCMTSCAIQERGSLAAALDRALLPPPSAISPPPPPPTHPISCSLFGLLFLPPIAIRVRLLFCLGTDFTLQTLGLVVLASTQASVQW